MKNQFSEVIKIKKGEIFNLSAHQERINRTLLALNGEKIDLEKHLQELPKITKKGLIKCRIVYSKAKIESIEFSEYTFLPKNKVAVMENNAIFYPYKSTDRSKFNLLKEKSECDDVIITQNGQITDALFSNLVFKSAEGLFTPTHFLLRGTKRDLLIKKKIISEKEIAINEIHLYDKIYFINAMIDLEDNISIAPSSLIYL